METRGWLTAALASRAVVYSIGGRFAWNSPGWMLPHAVGLRQFPASKGRWRADHRQPALRPTDRARLFAVRLRAASDLAIQRHIEEKHLAAPRNTAGGPVAATPDATTPQPVEHGLAGRDRTMRRAEEQ